MLKKILCFFRGYLIIDIRGNALERLISQLIAAGINLWKIERIKKSYYRARIYAEDFKEIRPIVRKRLCNISISEKKGLPFLSNILKKKYFLFIGFVLFLLIFYLASSFMWFIEIDGLKEIPQKDVYRVLNGIGIKPGILKSRVDINAVEKILIKKIDKITWLDLEWQGTRLYIELVEKKIVEDNKPVKIVAAKDGVITDIILLKGHAVVKKGDTFVAGQTLIVPQAVDREELRRVEAMIRANVWYESYGQADIIGKEPYYTGDNKRFFGLKIGSSKFKVPFSAPDYKKYSIEARKKSFPQWRNIEIPIELIIEDYKEVEFVEIKRDKDAAYFSAKESALQKLLKQLSATSIILDSRLEYIETENANRVKVRILLKVEENIAKIQ